MSVTELTPGLELGPSSWIEVPQARIDAFAHAIDDRGSIHVDDELGANGPYGTTVAHGFLTLSLLPAMCDEVMPLDTTIAVIYGLNRARFPARCSRAHACARLCGSTTSSRSTAACR